MPVSENHWQEVYARKDETAVSWFQELPSPSLELIEAHAPPGARIADIGGGASRLADYLLDRGFRVTVLDIAESALAKARARLGERASKITWNAADITRWQPSETFDLWHDRAVFHFLTTPEDRQSYRRAMAAAVGRGGHAVIGTFALDGPAQCSGLPVCRYDSQTLGAEFAPDFFPVGDWSVDHHTPGGGVQRFQFGVFRRV